MRGPAAYSGVLTILALAACASGARGEASGRRALRGHVAQQDIRSGLWPADQLIEAGRRLFTARFTPSDGVGRPAATGNPFPRKRRPGVAPHRFARGQGPDANACSSCHNQPNVGGAGDFAANVFVGLGLLETEQASLDRQFSNERGSPALHGTGIIELLAREVTADLHRLRNGAVSDALESGRTVRCDLESKGVSFGFVEALPSGEVNTDGVDGIDPDLVIRPFGAKGTVASLREFTVNAANLHHGMQAAERYGESQTGSRDFDEDGVNDELTEGDITALVVFQTSLPCPGRTMPADKEQRDMIERGERLFHEARCAECHVASMPLDSALFAEPGPYNFEGNLRPTSDASSLRIDLADLYGAMLETDDEGRTIVRAYTDFKRHRIADSDRPHLRNEIVEERYLPTETFLTKRLWACGDTAPYGHRGDLVTLDEAIRAHGGEANESRVRYEAMSVNNQDAVVAFLESMRIVPAGSSRVVIEPPEPELPYQ